MATVAAFVPAQDRVKRGIFSRDMGAVLDDFGSMGADGIHGLFEVSR